VIRDALTHAVVNIWRALGRSLAFAAAALLATGLLTFAVTDARSSQADVTGDFDALAATHLTVATPVRGLANPRLDATQIEAIRELRGVVGVAWLTVSEADVLDGDGKVGGSKVWSVAGDASALALEVDGRPAPTLTRALYLGGASDAGRAATRFERFVVGGTPLLLDGEVTRSPVLPDLTTSAVVVADGSTPDLSEPGALVVQVKPGWAGDVGRRLATQIAPGNERSVLVAYPPEPEDLRNSVTTTVGSLVWFASLALLVLGALAVAVATVFRVLSERRLLGLYRAIGASGGFVILSIVAEAALTGAVGGLAGAVVGVGAAAAKALATGTPLVVPWILLVGAVLCGFVANALGAFVPAWRSVREPPLSAIRSR